MQMRQDCFSSGWVELFGLSCCRLLPDEEFVHVLLCM